MDTITRRVKGVLTTYDILTTEEANEAGRSYKHWREAKGGELCVSDDGFVTTLLQRLEYTDKKNRKKTLFTLPYARVWGESKKPLLFGPRKVTGNYHDISGRSWQDKEAGKTRTKNVVKLYVQQYLQGKVDYAALGQAYRPDQKIPEATVRRLFKQERIQEMVGKEIQELLKRKGITQESVLDLYDRAIKLAESKGDAGVIIKVADRFAEWVGLEAQKQLPAGDMPAGFLEGVSETELQYDREAQARLTEGSPDGAAL